MHQVTFIASQCMKIAKNECFTNKNSKILENSGNVIQKLLAFRREKLRFKTLTDHTVLEKYS